MRKSALLLGSILLSNMLCAQTTTTTVGTAPQNPIDKKFGFIADLSFSSNFEADGNVNKTYGSSVDLSASYKLPNEFTIAKRIVLEKALNNDREQKISSSYFALSKTLLKLENEITLSAATRAYLPYNKDERDDKGYNGGLYFAPTLVIPLSTIGVDPLTLTLRPAYSQSFNDFETDNERNILIERRFTQTYLLDYAITDKLGAGLSAQYIMAWDYRGNRSPDKYLLEESLSYSLMTGLDIYASHGISDNTFAPNGTDNNIEFASRDSEVSLGLTYTY